MREPTEEELQQSGDINNLGWSFSEVGRKFQLESVLPLSLPTWLWSIHAGVDTINSFLTLLPNGSKQDGVEIEFDKDLDVFFFFLQGTLTVNFNVTSRGCPHMQIGIFKEEWLV